MNQSGNISSAHSGLGQQFGRPSGLLCLGLRMQHPTRKRFVPPGFSESAIEDVLAVVRRAGFRDVRQERQRLERVVVCVLAKK